MRSSLELSLSPSASSRPGRASMCGTVCRTDAAPGQRANRKPSSMAAPRQKANVHRGPSVALAARCAQNNKTIRPFLSLDSRRVRIHMTGHTMRARGCEGAKRIPQRAALAVCVAQVGFGGCMRIEPPQDALSTTRCHEATREPLLLRPPESCVDRSLLQKQSPALSLYQPSITALSSLILARRA